ncbi:MAG: sensor domain-containing diguanylate cyclase [Lachnospiraceae bacterium]|nr:sensor domain-containing diguanylate cyclase [Lachnospiraceae bacterium]
MYHCNVCFYFIGVKDNLMEIVKKVEPLEHFTHEFIYSVTPEMKLIEKANVIMADVQGTDPDKILKIILYYKKEGSELILIADKEQTEKLMSEDLSAVNDIWVMPMSEGEMKFRFLRWQDTYKMSKDFWQDRNYLDSVINSVPHMIWFKDKVGAHMKVNDYFCKIVNKTMEQIKGRGHYYIWNITPDEYAKGEFICMESEYEVMDKRETCIFDEDVKIGNEMRKLKTYKSPLFDVDGSVMGTVGVALDVTQELLYQEMIIKNANTDFLTGLYNRRYVYEYVEQMEEPHITVFGIDLNNFKSINDIYGHQEGDRALVLTAEVLQECMSGHLIARTGGDEFMVVIFGELSSQEIENTRKIIEEKLDNAYSKDETLHNISASVGAAHSDKGKEGFDMLVGEADSIMYSEKQKKKHSR